MVSFKHALGLLAISSLGLGATTQNNSTEWPVHDNGLTDLVKWYDCYPCLDSLMMSTHLTSAPQGPLQFLCQR